MAKKSEFIGCTVKKLPPKKQEAAALHSITDFPANAPANAHTLSIQQVVALATHYWGPGDRIFAVQFLDTTNRPLIDRILSHMNAWSGFTNKSFQYVARDGEVRVALGVEGYWSYLGQSILQIGRTSATMGLQGFTLNHSEAEYKRVVRHETGHTLGFQHGQLLPATVNRLDRAKTIAWFNRYYGWGEAQTVQNVLTPIDLSQAVGDFEGEDPDSIMTYLIPPECFKDGVGIVGGLDITNRDRKSAAALYPPREPPPPTQNYPTNIFCYTDGPGHVWWWNDSGVRFSVEPFPGFKGTVNFAANRKLVVIGAGKGYRPVGAVYDYETGQLLWNNYIPGIPQTFMGGVFPSVVQTNKGRGGHIRWSGYGGWVFEMEPVNFTVFGAEERNKPVPAGVNYRSLIT